MEKVLIINASPRAPKSNSRRYAEMFSAVCPIPTDYRCLNRANHGELARAMEHASHLLLVFPLYADAIPVTLLNFFKSLEKAPPRHRPKISVLINCGFLEPEQNDIAVRMVRLFCLRTGFPYGSTLRVGSGEAILGTPFRILVRAGIRRLARAIAAGKDVSLQVTMPLSKPLFLRASTVYWKNYGMKHGITKAEMETMQIEGGQ